MKRQRQGAGLQSGQGIRYTAGPFIGHRGVLVRCLDRARDVWTVKLEGQAGELVSPGGHFERAGAAASPPEETATTTSMPRCDVCGKPLTDPSAILWSYWSAGTKSRHHPSMAAMAAMADGVYCSLTCARQDTGEAKGARREVAHRLELERARGRGEHRFAAIWDQRERELDHADDRVGDWPPRVIGRARPKRHEQRR
jgi:hypothetical protein